MISNPAFPRYKPSASLILLTVLLASLWIAGGASRADAFGQVLVRTAAWAMLLFAVLTGIRPQIRHRLPVLLLLVAAVGLPLLQLLPLPPELWRMLPGRGLLTEAAALTNQAQPWRPWSIVPSATLSALNSLVVPMVVFILVAALPHHERSWLPNLLLLFVLAAAVLALLQLSGATIDNPFINDERGEVGAIFANRNHFALLLAFGCLLASGWATTEGRHSSRVPIALTTVLLFILTILATGSRAGLLLAGIALLASLKQCWPTLRRSTASYPRWLLLALLAGMVVLVAGVIYVSVTAERAASIDRLFAMQEGEDMRKRALPFVLAMIRDYFPFGAGIGSFDPVFRIREPFELLQLNYLNHAHNDFLELVSEAGVAGIAILAAGLFWWGRASMRAWGGTAVADRALARLGSTTLFLVLVASVFDYPARTPIIMMVAVIAAVWLADGARPSRSALPTASQHL